MRRAYLPGFRSWMNVILLPLVACDALGEGGTEPLQRHFTVVEILWTHQTSSLRGVQFDAPSRTVYFSAYDRGQILSLRDVGGQRNVVVLSGTGNLNHRDGSLREAEFYKPEGLALHRKAGRLIIYVACSTCHAIRKIDILNNQVTTIAGAPMTRGYANGRGSSVRFHHPYHIAIDVKRERLFIADVGNRRIRQLRLSDGTVSSVMGNGRSEPAVDGPAAQAVMGAMGGVAYHPNTDTVYVSVEFDLHNIRALNLAAGETTTVAGANTNRPVAGESEARGSVDGDLGTARFTKPHGLGVDPEANPPILN
mmetsp:Transcript_3612/g.6982  ORF Transcript_3612/g.6982 Transcript_3612/m.6982 type:complete len:309 (-) Transcript_3612:2850-3776(-)